MCLCLLMGSRGGWRGCGCLLWARLLLVCRWGCRCFCIWWKYRGNAAGVLAVRTENASAGGGAASPPNWRSKWTDLEKTDPAPASCGAVNAPAAGDAGWSDFPTSAPATTCAASTSGGAASAVRFSSRSRCAVTVLKLAASPQQSLSNISCPCRRAPTTA